MTQFERLFEPARIGQMELKNRIVMPPMGTSFATDKGYVSQQLIDYHEARAKGGVGLIIVEIAAPYFAGRQFSNELAISDDSYIPGFQELTGVIHKHGAKAAVQLHHAGREVIEAQTGYQPVGPSPIPTFSGATPRELTTDEIAEIVQSFATGAKRAKEAGFDGVEVHGAHQYLICSFLSSATNVRTDNYGGSIENKTRFLVEILRAIREAVGPDYPVWVRLSVQEYELKDGITIEETKQIVPLAIEAGAQAIHASAYGIGSYIMKAPSPDVPGFLAPLAEEVKKVSTVPVIAVGRMNPDMAEQTLEEGKADLIAIGRQLMADPEFSNKVAEGRLDEINYCIGCMECLERLIFKGQASACTVNPAMGREKELEIKPAAKSKKVVVLGGGPAGMEAARVAALRGHLVALYEKESKLGGQLNAAAVPPNKADLIPLIDYLSSQVKKAGVEVKLATEATLESALESNPDAVIVAAGSTPLTPDIPGADRPNVVTAQDALLGKTEVGQNVVVVGGGMVGCEIGHFLADQGKNVTIVEMVRRVASDMPVMPRRRLLDGLKEKKVATLTESTCEEIAEGAVVVTDGQGQKQTIQADTVVLAVGFKAKDDLYQALEGKVPEIHCIGDSSQPRRIADAIDEGYRVGLSL